MLLLGNCDRTKPSLSPPHSIIAPDGPRVHVMKMKEVYVNHCVRRRTWGQSTAVSSCSTLVCKPYGARSVIPPRNEEHLGARQASRVI